MKGNFTRNRPIMALKVKVEAVRTLGEIWRVGSPVIGACLARDR